MPCKTALLLLMSFLLMTCMSVPATADQASCGGSYYPEGFGLTCNYAGCASTLTPYLSVYKVTPANCQQPITRPAYIKPHGPGYLISLPELCLTNCTPPAPDDDQDDDGCPDNQFWNDGGQCKDEDGCEIGSGFNSALGQCEADDCPPYQYRGLGGSCTSCPPGTSCADPAGGDGGDGGDGGGNPAGCQSYTECRDEAEEALSCLHNDRDEFRFFYNGPGDFTSQCHQCAGPNYLNYSECQDATCPYGYNDAKGECWSDACPNGNCADPDGDDSSTPPQNPDSTDQRFDELLASEELTRDAIDGVKDEVAGMRSDINDALNDLNTTTQNGASGIESAIDNMNSDTRGRLDNLGDKLNGIRGEGTETNERLGRLECTVNPQAQGCIGYVPTDGIDAGEGLVTGLQGTGIYGQLERFKDVNISVSSSCPPSFQFNLHFLADYTVDVCSVFSPVIPLIRSLFIAFWGLVAFRTLGDA